MKRIRCPKCDEAILFDETKYEPGRILVFECPECHKQFKIRIPQPKSKNVTEENTEEIERMEQISNELREHSKLFIAYINNQAHKKELEQIYNVLNSVEEIKTLLPNKKEEVSISSFFEELSLY